MNRTPWRFSANIAILNPGGARSASSLRACPWPRAGVPLQAMAINATNNTGWRIGYLRPMVARSSSLPSGSTRTSVGANGRSTRVVFSRLSPDGDVAPHRRAVRSAELERQLRESEQTPLRFLALDDTQKHFPRSRVVLPGHIELWVPRLVQPLVEEPTKLRSGFLLYYALEVFTRCGRVAVGPVVAAEPAKEGRIADRAAEHVQHPRALGIAVRVQELDRIGRIT